MSRITSYGMSITCVNYRILYSSVGEDTRLSTVMFVAICTYKGIRTVFAIIYVITEYMVKNSFWPEEILLIDWAVLWKFVIAVCLLMTFY